MCKNNLKLTAQFCLSEHKKAFTKWNEGNILKSWYDDNNIFCIQYESGRWWHYKLNKDVLEWW